MLVASAFLSLLLPFSLAAINDEETGNAIADGTNAAGTGECETPGGCVQRTASFVPYSPLIPCYAV